MAINEFIFGLVMLLGSLMVPFSALYLALNLRRRAVAAPVLRRLG